MTDGDSSDWRTLVAALVSVGGFLLYVATFRRDEDGRMWFVSAWDIVERFLSRPRAGIELESFIVLQELWIGMSLLLAPANRVTLAFTTSSDLLVQSPWPWLLSAFLTIGGIVIYALVSFDVLMSSRYMPISSHMRFFGALLSIFVWFSVAAAEWVSPFTTDIVRGLCSLCLIAQVRIAVGARVHVWLPK